MFSQTAYPWEMGYILHASLFRECFALLVCALGLDNFARCDIFVLLRYALGVSKSTLVQSFTLHHFALFVHFEFWTGKNVKEVKTCNFNILKDQLYLNLIVKIFFGIFSKFKRG